MTEPDRDWVSALSDLGFARLDDSPTEGCLFHRLGASSDLELHVRAAGCDRWTVRLFYQEVSVTQSRGEARWVEMNLQALGEPSGECAVELSTGDLAERLPEFLGRSVLPRLDGSAAC